MSMRPISIAFLAIFVASIAQRGAWAKCWDSDAIVPFFCGEVEVTSSEDEFTVLAKLQSFTIPEAQSQDLGKFEKLKSQGSVAVDVPQGAKDAYKKGTV